MMESVLNEAERKITLLEEKIDYRFEDRQLAFDAITHSSFQNEHKGMAVSNERLEFLGDAVLEIVISEHLRLLHTQSNHLFNEIFCVVLIAVVTA